ncbi:MAG: DUF2452 domain-containing protein [Polyangiaceae bacterium]
MSDEGFKRDDAPRHEGPARSSPYPISRLAPVHDLIDVAREIQEADRVLGTVTGGKLQLLARQIRSLQEQARALLEQAHRDAELHRATCNFKRRPGHTYHFYRRPDGKLYVSMLSPEDWRGHPPHEFVGSYRLEQDMSWTPEEQIESVDAERSKLPPLLGS